MPKFKICTARFPGGGVERHESSGWMMETLLKMAKDPHIGQSGIVPFKKADTPITMVRNQCVLYARAQGCDYLLMIDSDMEPDPRDELGRLRYDCARPFWDTAWEFMLNHRDTPCVIAAPYCGPSPHHNVFVFYWETQVSDKPDVLPHLEQFPRDQATFRSGIEEVGALPTGLILYDLRVFDKVPHPYFYYEWKDKTESAKASTEDVANTRDLSLAWYLSEGKAGGRVFCAWDCWAVHHKDEAVGKPMPMAVEVVGERMRKALAEQHSATERLVMVGEGQAPMEKAPPGLSPEEARRLNESLRKRVRHVVERAPGLTEDAASPHGQFSPASAEQMATMGAMAAPPRPAPRNVREMMDRLKQQDETIRQLRAELEKSEAKAAPGRVKEYADYEPI